MIVIAANSQTNNDTVPKLPITKDQLVKNLVRKMNTFARIINNLPMAESITTEDESDVDLEMMRISKS